MTLPSPIRLSLSAYLHLDHWASRMPPTAKVRGLPDSGFFVDHEGPPHYHSAMHWLFYHMNSSSAVNSACLRAHSSSNDPHKCIFAQYAAPHIQTPFFPLQSQYDAWQVGFDLGVPVVHSFFKQYYIASQSLFCRRAIFPPSTNGAETSRL